MAAEASLSAIGWFLPIFAFLLVFFVVYAILQKSQVLGGDSMVSFFISFILAGFFVVEASLVEFVKFSSAWFAVILIGVFFIMIVLSFLPGTEPLEFMTKGNWFSWVILVGMIVLFITASAYVFNWAINWGTVQEWVYTDWFGMILLLVIALATSFIITRKVK